jgi:hypothetical protein
MATLENLAVAKAIAVAIGTGAIIIVIETGLGFATSQKFNNPGSVKFCF